ncbi:MAG: Na(+)/H(+) antiporter subunit B [Candidatus Limnocylindria bacterium]
MAHNPILRVVTGLLLPLIMLFALYVQFHGDFGPGGGFQAGVILSAAFVLYGLVFEIDRLTRVMPPAILLFLAPLGVLLYASVGVAGMALGGAFLDYNVLAADPKSGQHVGIFLVELGVGITVFSVILLMFVAFAGRGRGA